MGEIKNGAPSSSQRPRQQRFRIVWPARDPGVVRTATPTIRIPPIWTKYGLDRPPENRCLTSETAYRIAGERDFVSVARYVPVVTVQDWSLQTE